MLFAYVPMTKEYAEEIAYGWKYEDEYSFYNMTEDKEDWKEFLNSMNWEERLFAVLDIQRQLVGFFNYNLEDNELEIGLGLKPQLTGNGNGYSFVSSGIDFAIKKYNNKMNYIILSVASFNIRAINLYKKLGFEALKSGMIQTNGGEFEFLRMRKTLFV